MASNTRQAIALAAILAAASPISRADAVADWNRIALDAVTQSSRSSAQALAALATVHAAMFEALNFVEPRYSPRYTVASRGQPGTPGDAVAAGAAHHVLRELYPVRSAALDRALKRSLSAISDQQAAFAGAIAGRSIAQIVWAVRTSDAGGASRRPAAAAFERVNGRAHWDADVRGLNAEVAGLIASKRLDAVDGARLHALASAAAARAMTAYPDDGSSAASRASAAVQSVIKSESARALIASRRP